MDKNTYKKIIQYGEKVEWYGAEVPKELITPLVIYASDGLYHEINKLESTLDDLKGTSYDKRKASIESLKSNLRKMPYTLNGDVFLIKKKRYEEELGLSDNSKTKKQSKKTKK